MALKLGKDDRLFILFIIGALFAFTVWKVMNQGMADFLGRFDVEGFYKTQGGILLILVVVLLLFKKDIRRTLMGKR